MKTPFATVFGLALAAYSVCVWTIEPTLELIMSDPDWIGAAPESYHWSDDSSAVYFSQKRPGEDIRDTFRVDSEGGEPEAVVGAERFADANASAVYDARRQWVAWVQGGDILLKRLDDDRVQRVTATAAEASQPGFNADGTALHYLLGQQFYSYKLENGSTRQLTDIRVADDPDAAAEFTPLRTQQMNTYSTLAQDKRRAEALQQALRARQLADPAGAAVPIYLGKDILIKSRHLSPSGTHLALVTTEAPEDKKPHGLMPNYVTEDGKVATREVRTRVNRPAAPSQSVLLVNLRERRWETLDFSTLPGINEDPLRALRRSALNWHVKAGANPQEVEKRLAPPDRRRVSIEGIRWNGEGDILAVQVMSNDFKDRWLATLKPGEELELQHRLTDAAWINWDHNEFGWLNDNLTLWYLSEESGYSHLYRKHIDQRRPVALTEGDFVVREPAFSPDGQFAYLVANRNHPGNYQVFRVPVAGGELSQITETEGVSSFALSPDGEQLLVARSWFDQHPELYSTPAEGGSEVQLTHTVSADYAAIDWVIPDIVEVPSSHDPRPIYSKLYLPRDYREGQKYPAVMFVHGAGYTQNAHMGWPYYFREFMFHTLLANEGFIVLDMDYRASKGYGRDWRTSIYRQMGHPELEDYLDGIEYLVDEHSVDRNRIGIYGGSYGGFMAFMALFRAPEAFAAGAALRPVVDWMNYENDYTARILNTPLVDPLAYQRSSPINHAEGLNKPLLIAVGMQDDNVFFQDSVLMVQRLIELKKENFEMAVYPLDGHGFVHPESWLDEYRRIYKLMKTHLQ